MKLTTGVHLCVLFFIAPLAVAQTKEIINVQDARPIAAALQVLEERYGYAITHEDPELTNPSDIKDVTAEIAAKHGGRTTGNKILVPKGGTFQFHYDSENERPREDSMSLLQRMVTEYRAGGHPAFAVQKQETRNGTEWHVVPTTVVDDALSGLNECGRGDEISDALLEVAE
jgi:hypothetical protein